MKTLAGVHPYFAQVLTAEVTAMGTSGREYQIYQFTISIHLSKVQKTIF